MWFLQCIGIFTVVVGPIVCQAADLWGRKWLLVSLTLSGGVGSIIISRASSMAMAIAGFCFVGASFGIQPLLHAVTAEILPRQWRAWAAAIPQIASMIGSIMGLLVGAALNRTNDPASDGFRKYFYIALSCFLFATLVCALVYNPPPLPAQTQYTLAQKLRKLDWPGYFLFAAGLTLFSVALSYSKNPYPWSNARVSATFAVGVTLSLAFALYSTVYKKDGLFHHGLFSRNRNFSVATFAIFFEGVAFFAINSYLAFEIGVLYETDAVLVAVRAGLFFIVAVPSACLAGWWCARTRRVRWITVGAFALLTVFFVCMATARRGSDHAVWGYVVLPGMAFGVIISTLIAVAQVSTPPELISIASGLFISVRSLGGTVGLAVYNAIFNEAMTNLGENVGEAVVSKGLAVEDVPGFVAALASRNETAVRAVPGITLEIVNSGVAALLDTYVVAFRHVWIAAGCFLVLAAVGKLALSDLVWDTGADTRCSQFVSGRAGKRVQQPHRQPSGEARRVVRGLGILLWKAVIGFPVK